MPNENPDELTDDQRAAMAEAVTLIGGHAAVATLLGYKRRQNVWPWTSGAAQWPPEVAQALERGTDGKVTVDRLCPHSIWVRVKDASWPHPKGRPLVDTTDKFNPVSTEA